MRHWQEFDKNINGRDFVTGDVHGYFNLVKMKMMELHFDKNVDRLFSCGDLIDRGPYSDQAIEWIKEPWFFAIKGNHEEMLCQYHSGKKWQGSYASHGGQWAIDLSEEERQVHVDVLNKLPDVFEIDTINGKIGIVHAEVPVHDWLEFKLNYSKYEEESRWSFDLFNYAMQHNTAYAVDYIDYVIHGHSSVVKPIQVYNKFYIDSGFLSGKLSFLEINHPDGIKVHH
jgi:serine/threonine protein phosphatase 1